MKRTVCLLLVLKIIVTLCLLPDLGHPAQKKIRLMDSEAFVEKLVDCAENYKTVYVLGCFGAPLTDANKERYISSYSYNRDEERRPFIEAASEDTFGFDCVCLIKGVLWGWNGDLSHKYGGARYGSNGVPDISADKMITVCLEVTPKIDPDEMIVGELLWMEGHVGIYIGNGLVVECSPKWENGVQITSCDDTLDGYNYRAWKLCGKLPYIAYRIEAKQFFKQALSGAKKLLTK